MSEHVVSVGVDLLADAVGDQAADVLRVDWRPPLPGTEDDLATVALDPLRPEANARALDADAGRPGACWSTCFPPTRRSAWRGASSCTPVPRSPGSGHPGPSVGR